MNIIERGKRAAKRASKPRKLVRTTTLAIVAPGGKKVSELTLVIAPGGHTPRKERKGEHLIHMTRAKAAFMLRMWRQQGSPYAEDASDPLASAIKMVFMTSAMKGWLA